MTNQENYNKWLVFHRFQMSREKYYAPKINKVLKAQVNQFITAVNNNVPEATALVQISSTPLYILLKELYTDAAVTYGAKIIASLPKRKARMPIGFNDLVTRIVLQYFQTELLNDVEDITTTTRNKIAQVMIDSYPLGLSFDEIVKQLTAIDFTRIRARLIARTETVTAANKGAMIAAEASGLKLDKFWISAQDNRTRRTPRDRFDHLDMNGITVGFNDSFVVNGELMKQPGDRSQGASAGNICNCRCTVGFKVID